MRTSVVIVQHGEKESSSGDPGLTERGARQAEAAADVLAPLAPAAVVSSPLLRARQTAEPLARHLGLELAVDARLRERLNLDADHVRTTFVEAWERTQRERDWTPPGGRSSRATAADMSAALLAHGLPGQLVVLAGHGGATTDLLRDLLGDGELERRAPDVLTNGVPGGALTWLSREEGRWSVERIAEVEHIPTSDRTGHAPVASGGPEARPVAVWNEPTALGRLPPPYRHLLARLREVVVPDLRIRAVWLSGSLARGDADGASDLDVLLAVADEHLEAFDDQWRDWLSSITPVLVARALPFARATFTATTTAHARLDVVTEMVSDVASSPFRHRFLVMDRDGLAALVPAPDLGRGPDVDRLQATCVELLRVLELLPFILFARGDLLSAAAGVNVCHSLLIDLFVETNQPLPAVGVKRIAARLTPAQQAVLLGLPPVAADEDLLVEALHAVIRVFRGPGRHAVVTAGGGWPTDVDEAVHRFVDEALARRAVPDTSP